jgi:hypothetical protein
MSGCKQLLCTDEEELRGRNMRFGKRAPRYANREKKISKGCPLREMCSKKKGEKRKDNGARKSAIKIQRSNEKRVERDNLRFEFAVDG